MRNKFSIIKKNIKVLKTVNGFTLIELLVTASLIALLSTIGIAGFQAVSRSGRDALRKSDLEKLRSSLEVYKSESTYYPDASSACIAGLNSSYINPYPVDPQPTVYNYCYVKLSPLTYELCAHLENGGSGDYCGNGTEKKCGPAGLGGANCNYRVVNP